jgi:Uma2 family endonuclease
MSMAAHTLPPPLRDGDRLTSDEFMRRWEAMPDLKHAELLDGIVFMASPVSQTHSIFGIALSHWLATYEDHTPGCEVGAEATWLMGPRNVPQPDLTLRLLPEIGGQSRVEGDYAVGAPELIVEVAVSSRARDLGVKPKVYERMGVREYLVAIAGAKQFSWSVLTERGYEPLEPDSDGILRSRCFPGLWLDPAALWSRDRKRLLTILQQGSASPGHTGFVASLANAKR